MALGKSLLKQLSERQVVTPLIHIAVKNLEQDDGYTIEVDLSRGKDFAYHPSTHCIIDPRKLFFLLDPESRPSIEEWRPGYEIKMAVSQGTATHHIVQHALVSAGFVEEDDVEVLVRDETRNIKGSMDFLIKDPRSETGKTPVELKSMTINRFDFVNEPDKSWVAQFNVYLDVLGYDYGYIVVVKQGMPYTLKEYRIEKDQALLDEIYAKWEQNERNIANRDIPQKRCIDPRTKVSCSLNSEMMKSCPARVVCLESWKDSYDGD